MATRLEVSQVAGVLQQLVIRQSNKCGICGNSFTVWDIAVLDHDHKTGFIRGALHNSCNGTEGRVKVLAQRGHKGVSSADYVIGLGKYLEKHKTPQYNFIHPKHTPEEKKKEIRNKKARETRAKLKAKKV